MIRETAFQRVLPDCVQAVLLAATLFAGPVQAQTTAVSVESLSPQGEVRSVQQVAIRFSHDMTPLGRADAAPALQIDCGATPEFSQRWVDSRRWVAEFKTPLPVGTRCAVRLQPGLHSLSGLPVASAGPWSFNTGGPKVVWQQPYSGARLTEQQLFLLQTDAPLARDTLAAVRCKVNEQTELAVTLLDLAATRIQWQRARGDELFVPERTVALRCARALPADASLQLVWSHAVGTPAGVASGSDQLLGPYRVRPPFSAKVVCAQIAGSPGCDPRQSLRVEFSERVNTEALRHVSLRDARGQALKLSIEPDYPPATARVLVSEPASPEALLPEGSTLTLQLPGALHDADGRDLSNPAEFPKAVPIATLPPYLGFAEPAGVLPLAPGQSARWPLAVRRLEAQVAVQLMRLGGEMRAPGSGGDALQQRARASASALALWHSAQGWPQRSAAPTPVYPVLAQQQLAWAGLQTQSVPGTALEALNFVPVTLTQPGLYLLEAHSPRFATQLAAALAARDSPPTSGLEPRASLVQVSNLNLSVRLSALGDSLLWVTAIDTGLPVPGVEADWLDCHGKLLAQGSTDTQGLLKVSASLTHPAEAETCPGPTGLRHGGVAVVARKGPDLALLSDIGTTYRYGFDSYSRSSSLGHTVLDRTLLKAGDTLHMQHLQRRLTLDGFAAPEPGSGKVEIRFQDGSVVATLALQWNASGSANSQWIIPADSKLGRYSATVTGPDGRSHQANFQVEEFRSPVFDAGLSGQAEWRGDRQSLPVTLKLSYLAGGAAAGEQVTLQGQYRAGAQAPVAGYTFSDATLPEWKPPAFASQPVQLNAQGQRLIEIAAPVLDRPVTLHTEMKFSDPNGEVQTVGRGFALWPADTRLGLRAMAQTRTDPTRHTVLIRAVVLDQQDRPLAQRQLQITAQAMRWRSQNKGSPVELLGSARPVCSAASDERGQIECEWTGLPEKIDSAWLFAVTAQDSLGRRITSSLPLHEYQLRWAPDNEVLTLAKDQSQPLAAGAPARLMVQAPFWPASLLLTVEREGVLQASTQRLTQARSLIELPLEARFAPNVQIRARFVRGLAGLPATAPDTAEAALTAEHQLAVKIAPDRFALDVTLQPAQAQLRPGGSTRVQVTVRQRSDGAAAAHARVTLVAVDEALLSLKDNPSWDVLSALLRERASGVRGAALDPLIRYRLRFGPQPAYWPPDDQARRAASPGVVLAKMAAPPAPAPAPGGALRSQAASEHAMDGSDKPADEGSAVRRDFSSLALWRTDVELDAQGRASVPVTFNDSLTRWRVIAVALGGADRFGHGQTSVQISQPLQLYSGLPPLLRSGDRLTQKVTLRNTGSTALTLQFSAQATLQLAADAPAAAACDPSSRQNTCGQASPSQDTVARGLSLQRSLSLAPGQAQDLAWPVAVPAGVERLDWDLRASSSDGQERDALRVSQRIIPALPVTVRQATLLQIRGETSLPVSRPSDAQAGLGGVQVSLSDSLVRSALQQVRQWMADYPYACLEQKASKLVVSGDAAGWASLMTELPEYLDAQGMARYFNESSLSGSETLTAYLLDLSAAQNWAIPAVSREKMLTGLQRALQSKTPTPDWQPLASSASTQARLLALQATLAVQGRVTGASTLALRPDDLSLLPTLALTDWARTLLALPATTASSADLQQAAGQLRSRYDVQGTRLNWRSDERDHWWWWMWSNDVAMARSALVVQQWLARDSSWQADLPLLIQGLVARQQQGRWSTTVGNVWGTLALQRFAASVEAGPVSGQTTAALAGASPGRASLSWPQPAITLLRLPVSQPQGTLRLSHQGSGAPWANVSITAAVRLLQPRHAGLQVEKIITPVEQKQAGQWSVGDVARVTLKLQSQAQSTWVVVHDPIPSGATILGRGLGRESQLAQQGQGSSGWAWPAFIERAADSYRAYYRWVPRGNWSVEYTLRLNNAGQFELPATHVEAMYAPEIFGESPNAVWSIQPDAGK